MSVRPAMTAEEWLAGECKVAISVDDPVERKALAAKLLHGQPYGFTREHAELCRLAADAVDALYEEQGHDWLLRRRDSYHALADLIEDLLPPPWLP